MLPKFLLYSADPYIFGLSYRFQNGTKFTVANLLSDGHAESAEYLRTTWKGMWSATECLHNEVRQFPVNGANQIFAYTPWKDMCACKMPPHKSTQSGDR